MGGIGGWSVSQVSRTVVDLRADYSVGLELAPVLLCSDAHWDNPHCCRPLLKRHMDEAIAKNAPIILGGDFFCAMQGQWDKRASKSDIRPEHQRGDYLDSLVRTAAEWLEPYAKNIVLACQGNHETAIRRHHETDLTERLVERLRLMGSPCHSGGYRGWVRFKPRYSNYQQTLKLHYMHGHGGGGPITRGKIDFSRYWAQVQADAIWCQHVHWNQCDYDVIQVLTEAGTIRNVRRWSIRTPSYKDEYEDGHGGFQVERGQGPRPLGGAWLSVYLMRKNKDRNGRFCFHAELTRD